MILILDDILRYWQNCKSLEPLGVTKSLSLAHFHVIVILITDKFIISQHIAAVNAGLCSLIGYLNDIVLLITRNDHDLTGRDVDPVHPVGLHDSCPIIRNIIINYHDQQSEMWTIQ